MRNFLHTTTSIQVAADFCRNAGKTPYDPQNNMNSTTVPNIPNGEAFILQLIVAEGIPYLTYDGHPYLSNFPTEKEVILPHHTAIRKYTHITSNGVSANFARYMHPNRSYRFPVVQALIFPHPYLKGWLKNSHDSNTSSAVLVDNHSLAIPAAESEGLSDNMQQRVKDYVNAFATNEIQRPWW